ncbi:MAG: PDZ domain-containing protein [Vicinamibacterales bacterium]
MLVTTALLALVALWLLARLRFAEEGASSSAQPIAPILAPLVHSQGFADLAETLTSVTARTNRALVTVRRPTSESAVGSFPAGADLTVLRVRDEVGVTLLPEEMMGDRTSTLPLIAGDTATGLAIVRIESGPTLPASATLRPDDSAPRYVLASAPLQARNALFPVLIVGLSYVTSPLWTGEVLAPATRADVTPGAFVFSLDGEWVGLAARRDGATVIVPAPLVVANVDRLLARRGPPGYLGVRAQALSAALGRATHATVGVLVRYVDAAGPARERLRTGDVIEATDHRPLWTFEDWQRRQADFEADVPVTLSVRRAGQLTDIEVTPQPVDAGPGASGTASLPAVLRMRYLRGQGSEVLGVDSRAVAATSALRPGDIITLIGTSVAPTPDQVRRALRSASSAEPVLVAVRRDDDQVLLAVER